MDPNTKRRRLRAMTESFEFKAEIQQLLNILVHSLYTEREIFLRELISNASDALNRLQFEMLTDRDVLDPDAELAIRVEADEEARTITISDTGIGMTRDEIATTWAPSPTRGRRPFWSSWPGGAAALGGADRPVWRGLLLGLYGRRGGARRQPLLPARRRGGRVGLGRRHDLPARPSRQGGARHAGRGQAQGGRRRVCQRLAAGADRQKALRLCGLSHLRRGQGGGGQPPDGAVAPAAQRGRRTSSTTSSTST